MRQPFASEVQGFRGNGLELKVGADWPPVKSWTNLMTARLLPLGNPLNSGSHFPAPPQRHSAACVLPSYPEAQ